jgi:L-histidine Nalpha-methyltransferase
MTEPRATGVATATFENHLDDGWARRALVDDVRRGLGRQPLQLPPRWLYDDRGSDLFDRITRLEEYYPTEAERSILRREAASIAALTNADTLIELGSGTSEKTRTLIAALREHGTLERFVPFDVSEATLRDAADQLTALHPGLHVHGIVGDFTLHLAHLPADGVPLVAFLGSTIGNFHVEERHAFLAMLGEGLPAGAWFLLGVDLVKHIERLVLAYDDPAGVTAEFSRNVLHVLNRELEADFDVEAFDHVALWDPTHERMDLRLRVNGDQPVAIPGAGLTLDLHDGEEIRIEVSTKFRIPTITGELADAGFETRQVWTDPRGDVALVLAQVTDRDRSLRR